MTDLRAFDRGGGWHAQGARSCAHWLSWRVGWGLGAAREHLRVAARLAELPLLDAALRRGEVSYAKLRAITQQCRESQRDSAETSRPAAALAVAAGRSRAPFDRADALVQVAQGYLRGDHPEGALIELVVSVPAATLRGRGPELAGDPCDVAVLADGTCVSAETARRLAVIIGAPRSAPSHGSASRRGTGAGAGAPGQGAGSISSGAR